MHSSKRLSVSYICDLLHSVWGPVNLYTESLFYFWGTGSFTLNYWLSLAEFQRTFGLTPYSNKLQTIFFIFDISCSPFSPAFLRLINISLLLLASFKLLICKNKVRYQVLDNKEKTRLLVLAIKLNQMNRNKIANMLIEADLKNK